MNSYSQPQYTWNEALMMMMIQCRTATLHLKKKKVFHTLMFNQGKKKVGQRELDRGNIDC